MKDTLTQKNMMDKLKNIIPVLKPIVEKGKSHC